MKNLSRCLFAAGESVSDEASGVQASKKPDVSNEPRDIKRVLWSGITLVRKGETMKITLNLQDLLILAATSNRCLIAKDILSKEDIMADLARQGIDAEIAFKIQAYLNETPEQ